MKKNIKTLGFVESQSVCPKMNNRSHPCTHQRIFKNLDENLIIIYFGLMGVSRVSLIQEFFSLSDETSNRACLSVCDHSYIIKRDVRN